MSVDLPLPVAPTNAMVRPPGTRNDTSLITGLSLSYLRVWMREGRWGGIGKRREGRGEIPEGIGWRVDARVGN